MLWALTQPVSFLALAVAFCAALLLRRFVHYGCSSPWKRRTGRSPIATTGPATSGSVRTTAFDVHRDVDPYGVVAALVGGTGWGGAAQVRIRGGVGALLAGPAVIIAASQLMFAYYVLAGLGSTQLVLLAPSDVLRGMAGEPLQQFVLSVAVGLLAFGVVALLPLPPLDGWGVTNRLIRKPGGSWQRARYWLEDRNIGALILLIAVLIPLFSGRPLLLWLLDVLLTPVLRAWA
jgi:Zn-dependent protease